MKGLELIGGLVLASRTVGGAVCAAGLEASIAGGVGQFAAHVLQLKVLNPGGKKFVINEAQKRLLGIMRLSYDLLGVVYAITLRVRPYARTGFRCDTQADGWDEFALDFAQFASHHRGVPFFNQTRNAAPGLVTQRFGPRLALFNKARRELDPEDRLLNRYFASYMPPLGEVPLAE